MLISASLLLYLVSNVLPLHVVWRAVFKNFTLLLSELDHFTNLTIILSETGSTLIIDFAGRSCDSSL